MRIERQCLPRERHWTCARRLRERRIALGLTQVEVADALRREGLDLGNRTLSAMEHGHALDLGWLPELAAALDCTTTYLLGMTSDPHGWTPDLVPAHADGSADLGSSTLESPHTHAPAPAPASSAATPSRERLTPVTHHGWILGPDVPDRHSATG